MNYRAIGFVNPVALPAIYYFTISLLIGGWGEGTISSVVHRERRVCRWSIDGEGIRFLFISIIYRIYESFLYFVYRGGRSIRRDLLELAVLQEDLFNESLRIIFFWEGKMENYNLI